MKINDEQYRNIIEKLVFFIICVLAAIALSAYADREQLNTERDGTFTTMPKEHTPAARNR